MFTLVSVEDRDTSTAFQSNQCSTETSYGNSPRPSWRFFNPVDQRRTLAPAGHFSAGDASTANQTVVSVLVLQRKKATWAIFIHHQHPKVVRHPRATMPLNIYLPTCTTHLWRKRKRDDPCDRTRSERQVGVRPPVCRLPVCCAGVLVLCECCKACSQFGCNIVER